MYLWLGPKPKGTATYRLCRRAVETLWLCALCALPRSLLRVRSQIRGGATPNLDQFTGSWNRAGDLSPLIRATPCWRENPVRRQHEARTHHDTRIMTILRRVPVLRTRSPVCFTDSHTMPAYRTPTKYTVLTKDESKLILLVKRITLSADICLKYA